MGEDPCEDKQLVEQGMYTFWMLWNNRNNCFHNLTCGNSTTMKSLIAIMVSDYKYAVSLPASVEQMTREVWFPPPRDYIKINVDAAFCSTTRIASLGVVSRNMDAKVFLSYDKD